MHILKLKEMMDNETLNNIPQAAKAGFPTGVVEMTFYTKGEIEAFLAGLQYTDDADQYNGTPFRRDDRWVVRICVGDWDGEADTE
jgi:hypothetical protein